MFPVDGPHPASEPTAGLYGGGEGDREGAAALLTFLQVTTLPFAGSGHTTTVALETDGCLVQLGPPAVW